MLSFRYCPGGAVIEGNAVEPCPIGTVIYDNDIIF